MVNGNLYQGSFPRNAFTFQMRNMSFAQMEVSGKLFSSITYNPKQSMIDPFLMSLKVVNKLYVTSASAVT